MLDRRNLKPLNSPEFGNLILCVFGIVVLYQMWQILTVPTLENVAAMATFIVFSIILTQVIEYAVKTGDGANSPGRNQIRLVEMVPEISAEPTAPDEFEPDEFVPEF